MVQFQDNVQSMNSEMSQYLFHKTYKFKDNHVYLICYYETMLQKKCNYCSIRYKHTFLLILRYSMIRYYISTYCSQIQGEN